MKTLKDFVRQNARPEGSMSEGWLIQEGIVFISHYLHQGDSSLPHPFSLRHSLSVMDVREEDGPDHRSTRDGFVRSSTASVS
jgi:hypothetical protein